MSQAPSTTSIIVVNLHGLKLAFQTSDPPLQKQFEQVYGHLPRETGSNPDILITWHIYSQSTAPPPPEMPIIAEEMLISYYGHNNLIAVRLPKYGLVTINLTSNRLDGLVTRQCLEAYGVFEDVLMITLAPLYRRRGWFPLHAFAALAPNGQAALISGDMGSGKTTTGLALLSAGWKLLSNDSPLLQLTHNQVSALAYPGQLSAFDDSLARFDHLTRFIPLPPQISQVADTDAPAKRVFRAEEVFADPWASTGVVGGVFFPQVVPGLNQSELVELSAKDAALRLIPQAIEGWDKITIAPSLQLIRHLVEQAPCYALRLSPQVEQLPEVISGGLHQ